MGTRKERIYILLAVCTAMIYGGGVVWNKSIMNAGLTPNALLTFRFAAVAIIYLIINAKSLRTIDLKQLKHGVILGLIGYGVMFFQMTGLAYTSPANGAFLNACYITFVPFVSRVFLKQKIKRHVLLCAVLCLIGVYFLASTGGRALSLGLGDALCLIGAVFYAVQIVYMAKCMELMQVKTLMLLSSATIAVISLPVLLLTGDAASFLQVQWEVVVPNALAVVFLSTLLGVSLQMKIVKELSPSRVAIIMSLDSLFATLFSILLKQDMIRMELLLGGGLIFLSIVLSELLTMKQPLLNHK
ncbi:DMT family transporter [Eubacteriales bacterium OttesenSCG-928-K08]|nr:DMT family transporter [Eubacteriales bacterium OttesenSCG-928-K08]